MTGNGCIKGVYFFRLMGTAIFGLVLTVTVIWLGGFIFATDFSVETKNIIPSHIKKILLVFPHADDEALTAGGFISSLTKSGKEVSWLILTEGEKGNPQGISDEKLKKIRLEEAKKAAEVYKVKNQIQKDYPDGGLEKIQDKIETNLKDIINELGPDLVITYDLAGLYGHPDHVVTSEIVTRIIKDKSNIKLWYVSYPKRILDTVSLPQHMANDVSFKRNRVYPTHKVWIGTSGVVSKIKAVYSYKSQKDSFISSFPIKFIPLWFYVSLTPFEYFHDVK